MLRGFPNMKFIQPVVIAFAVTTVVISCKSEPEVEVLDLQDKPVQTVAGMNAVQSKNGLLQMRMESDLMQRYDNDSLSYELFPEGFKVFAYDAEGNLETQIESDIAKHTTFKSKDNKKETWEAFGNVVITNFKKGERLETDTLYWNREQGVIHTHTLVKMYSPQGFMQGYGMESDEMARNAHILKPFDSYGVISRDSSAVPYTDTVNFIGPRAR